MRTSHIATLVLSLASLAAGQVMAMAPDQAAVQGKTRAQVKAELSEAIRTGNIFAWDHQGRNLNELYPNRYAGQSVAAASQADTHAAPNVASSYEQPQSQGVFSGGN